MIVFSFLIDFLILEQKQKSKDQSETLAQPEQANGNTSSRQSSRGPSVSDDKESSMNKNIGLSKSLEVPSHEQDNKHTNPPGMNLFV